jgi:hypothetical protein
MVELLMEHWPLRRSPVGSGYIFEGTIVFDAGFPSRGGNHHGPIRRGPEASCARRFLSTGLNRPYGDWVSVHHDSGGEVPQTEATYPMFHTHVFREQSAIVRSIVWFLAIAAALCWFVGPIGILYALGCEVLFLAIYLLMTGFASLLDPDVY